jgi:lipoprotein-anchoring transpeptidase ErfK/SrfK
MVGLTAVVAGATALSGCGFGQLQLHTLVDGAAASAAQVSLLPAPQPSTGTISPDKPIVVSVADGRLTGVEVTRPDGKVLKGALSTDATAWSSKSRSLDYGTTYSVHATAVDRLGNATEVNSRVTTVKPDKFLSVSQVSPSGQDVGVGFPMKVTLSREVSSDKARARIEKHLVVTTDGEKVTDGAWRWESGSILAFRPPTYWPGNATIALRADLKGVRLSKKVWGESDSTNTWSTGDRNISYVNLQTHMMRVTQNGKTVRTIPIAAGKPGFDTRSGSKVILSKELSHRMDAASGGTPQDSPEYYDLVVKYAMRLTWSGEFLHAAPWSDAAQGHANTSHGCTGMSDANALWMYNFSKIGDVVEYTGSDRQMTIDNGIGDWNVPLARWAAGDDS